MKSENNLNSGITSDGKLWDKFAGVYDQDMGISDSINEDAKFYAELAKSCGGPILDVGCGTGRVSIPLLKQGYQIVGVEPSAKMLEIFKNKVGTKNCTLYNCDALKWDNPQSISFKLIILPFDVFLQFLSREKQEYLLKKMIKWLSSDGLLVIDVFRQKFEDLVGYKNKLILDYERDNSFRYKAIKTNFDMQINEITYFYFKKENDEIKDLAIRKAQVRYITESEGFLMLEKAGFNKIECYGGFNKEKSCYKAKRIIFLASRGVK